MTEKLLEPSETTFRPLRLQFQRRFSAFRKALELTSLYFAAEISDLTTSESAQDLETFLKRWRSEARALAR